MVLPVYLYGQPVLREETVEVTPDSEELPQLIEDLIDTLHEASGIGLAAPQIGRRERVFVVDLTALKDDLEEAHLTVPPQPMVFINPEVVWESPETAEYEEGCLSIPELRENVVRPASVRMQFLDQGFTPQEMQFDEFMARVVQHEFDHLEGVLFIDRLSPLKRRLLKRRLREVARGEVETEYPVAANPEFSGR